MSGTRDSVTVRIPGSTSNCGSGFDTLGIALTIYNRVHLERTAGEAPIAERPADARAHSMVAEAAAAFTRESGAAAGGFRYRIDGDVPAARGLGSSVTIIGGILAGLNALHATGLSRTRLVALATAIEGHPDNASAGILGGFCVSRSHPATQSYLGTVQFSVPDSVAFVVVSPEIELLTKESRGALPAQIEFFDAVRSINGAAYLVAAFASGDFARLRDCGGDGIHEPYRLARIPGGQSAIAAGIESGAWTGWLSGSGSSVLCVSDRPSAQAVLQAMTAAFDRASVGCAGRVLSADHEGAVVE